jgi:hypothetical protein
MAALPEIVLVGAIIGEGALQNKGKAAWLTVATSSAAA